ncbi:DUF6934 family protein [Mucilaginibacter psychrotolerans]|uniref:Uncharacterized protein n=1 Tax=Mucilaginibacter psychrotolerans TaxID=1524096 RepID=A0A4Y8S612_9SPHI|nr:hypothetical protein [Mucilaginibacter psychrotolerans]TFF33907.1 hypothetical protein E2R66_23810 [Mucilaginibacter psychrotolerans]
MNLSRYDYIPGDDFTEYEFFSEGPNGRIRKMIAFTIVQEYPFLIYNLAFGDVDAAGEINDAVTSNNEDRDKVLATVAHSINDFCDRDGNHLIFAQGSNPARTRLYQMSIARNFTELQSDFDIKGLTDKGWEPFAKNVNYLAFLTNRK